MSRFTKTIGKRLLNARKHKGLTQEGLAELTRLTENTISLIECGDVNTGYENLYKICKSLNFSMIELFSGY